MGGPDQFEEALSLLRGREMERTRPPRNEAAARSLFESLRSLNGKYHFGVSADEDWYEIEVQLPGAPAILVAYARDIGVTVGAGREHRVEVELDLDPDTKQFVGREVDRYRVPNAGDVAIQRRSALAVLVEAVIKIATSAKARTR